MVRLAISFGLCLISSSIAAAQKPGLWTLTSTFVQDGKEVRREAFALELRSNGDAGWLLVQTATGSQGGADSTWMSPRDMHLLAHRTVGPMSSEMVVKEHRVVGSMRHPDGSEMKVDFQVDSLPFEASALPFVLARERLVPGAEFRFPIVDLHAQDLQWITVTVQKTEATAPDEVPLDFNIGDLAIRILIDSKTKEPIRVSGTGPDGMHFTTTYERLPTETSTASLEPHQATDSRAAFERLRGLVGTWSFTVDGRVVSDDATFRIAANDKVLVEDMGGMVTMYHLDGDKLMLTHYCNAGNQPRMRMTKADADNIAFEMYDITNLASPTSYHSNTLNVKFLSRDHVVLTYGGKSGRKEPPQVFELTRKK